MVLFCRKETPGFLTIFIVGEHYKRFVVSGWKGDLYGKTKTIRMIWALCLLLVFVYK
jgi:hypothetical protein